jgi:hypothetical protein
MATGRQGKLVETILDDNRDAFLAEFGRMDGEIVPNLFESLHDPNGKHPHPGLLRDKPPLVSVAAFFGSFNVLRAFVDLSFVPTLLDQLKRSIAHVACAGGNFDCCWELDDYGVDHYRVDFETRDADGRMPAEYAAEYGRLDLLQWLWIRGGLNAMAEYWKQPGAEEPDVLVYAAERGQADVLKFLIDVVGAPVYKTRELPGNAHVKALWGEWSRRAVSERTTATHAACAGGHADTLGVLLEYGANAKQCDGDRVRLAVVREVAARSEGDPEAV